MLTADDGAAPADDTVYEIGSITRAFTGSVLAVIIRSIRQGPTQVGPSVGGSTLRG
jgi:hypothetical protein